MSMYEMLPHFTVAGGSDGKESTCKVGDGFNPWVRKIPWRREHSYPLQYSGLENSVDRGVWWATGHGWQRVRRD